MLCALHLVLAVGVASAEETAILTEGSVWRSHVTFFPAVVSGGKNARIYGNITDETPPPPAGWTRPDFDDSGWTWWREPSRDLTLRLREEKEKDRFVWDENAPDTGVPLYSPGQYGLGRSIGIGLHCLRGRFYVEEPSKVGGVRLTVEFRGGLVVYVNGQEIGRAFLPQGEKIEPKTMAAEYTEDAFVNPEAEAKKLPRSKHPMVDGVLLEPEFLKRLNARIRRLDVSIPTSLLTRGVNVLALEFHRAPANPAGSDKPDNSWSMCGPVRVRLTGSGAVVSSVGRPRGFQVWNVNALTRISPFGSVSSERVDQGAVIPYERLPLTWGDPLAPLVPVRLVGPRNGFCTGQVGVSCDTAIKGLKASVGDLVRKNGGGRIPTEAVQCLYMTMPAQPFVHTTSPSVSFVDALYEAAPAEIPARSGDKVAPWVDYANRHLPTWADEGAAAAVWVKVKVPADAQPGEYHGTLTVSAEGHKPVPVGLALTVADYVVPEPKRWVSHVGAPHSTDTLSFWYKVPRWSEEHWKLIEKTMRYMGEIGAKSVFIPLRVRTWIVNEETLVYWVKQPDGSFKYDYRVFDRYMGLVRKYLNPDVYCLYCADFAGEGGQAEFSLLDPATGKVETAKGPEYKPTPEAVAFWKSVVSEVMDRLMKAGVSKESIMLGVAWEGGGATRGGINEKIELFKQVVPEGMKLVQVAHYGGASRFGGDIPFGYVMSVWGNQTGVKPKMFGAKNLPMLVARHYRSSSLMDVRPLAPRAMMRACMEYTMRGMQGMGPLGMDLWIFASDPTGRRRYPGPLEQQGASNLSMSVMGTSALLAPGPDGPITTARFEMFREGLQECEARMAIELALADEASRERLGEALATRCSEVIKERDRLIDLVIASRGFGRADGWFYWFISSDWEGRAAKLFNCAGDVTRALGK